MFTQIENTLLRTYRYDDFIVEIHDVDGNYEAWIHKEDYCVKEMSIGAPKYQQSLDRFVEIVEANMHVYISAYIEEYCDD